VSVFKVCTVCRILKSLDEFSNRKVSRDGKRSECKSCSTKSAMLWAKKNPDKVKINAKKFRETNKESCKYRKLKDKYNISEQEYLKLVNKQKNSCAICNILEKHLRRALDVDHCHKTGKVRGLLCEKCNKAIGIFNDDIKLFKKAINYLGKNNE
jgi:hypothetical protein